MLVEEFIVIKDADTGRYYNGKWWEGDSSWVRDEDEAERYPTVNEFVAEVDNAFDENPNANVFLDRKFKVEKLIELRRDGN